MVDIWIVSDLELLLNLMHSFLCLHDLIYLGHLTQGVDLLEHRIGVCLILLVCAKGCSEWFTILFTLLSAMYENDFSLQRLWYILSLAHFSFSDISFGFNFHFPELSLGHDIKSRLTIGILISVIEFLWSKFSI